MLIDNHISVWNFLKRSYRNILIILTYNVITVVAFRFFGGAWVNLPWQVFTLIGTAVSLYLGFKNNQAYQRMWEARKIWGAIVNSSRSWGTVVNNFITDQLQSSEKDSEEEIEQIKDELINRHIAWLYRLRRQLWKPQNWEMLSKSTQKTRKKLQKQFAPLSEEDELNPYVRLKEAQEVLKKKNPATQLLAKQSSTLKILRKKDLIDDFRHMAMQDLINKFYIHQGKCERIKNFPLPRQYSSFSNVAVQIFIMLVPIGLVPLFYGLGGELLWWTIPVATLISWIFWMMERVGDITESPFQGLVTDIPMTSICRAIEMDLKEMDKDPTNLSAVIPLENVLM